MNPEDWTNLYVSCGDKLTGTRSGDTDESFRQGVSEVLRFGRAANYKYSSKLIKLHSYFLNTAETTRASIAQL